MICARASFSVIGSPDLGGVRSWRLGLCESCTLASRTNQNWCSANLGGWDPTVLAV